MELLDDLDVSPIKAKTFKKSINIEITQDDGDIQDTQDINYKSNSDDDDNTNESFSNPVARALDFTKSSLLNISLGTNTPGSKDSLSKESVPQLKLFDTSRFELIKRRLNGELPEEEEQDTQAADQQTGGLLVEEEQATQQIEVESKTITASVSPEDIEQETQNIEQNNNSIDSTQMIQHKSQDKLTQKYASIDATTGIELETQKVPSNTVEDVLKTQSITQNDDEDDERIVQPTRKIRVVQDNLNEEEEEIPVHNINREEFTASQPAEEDLVATSKINQSLFLTDSEDEGEADNNISLSQTDAATQKMERIKRIEERAEKKRIERLLAAQNAKEKDNKKLDSNRQLQDELDADNYESDYQPQYSGDEDNYAEQAIDIPTTTIKKFDKSTLFAKFAKLKSENSHQDEDLDKTEETPISSQKSPKEDFKDTGLSDSVSDDDDFDFDAKQLLKSPMKEKSKTPLSFSATLKDPEDKPQVIELDDDDDDDDDNIKVEYSKSAMLDIKTMLSRKKAQKKEKPKSNDPSYMSKKQLWVELQKANKLQLKEQQRLNPELPKEKEMLQQESLSVEDLLQKHIDHNNRIREKEEEIEQRKRETLGSDSEDEEDYQGEDEYDEVPESDFDDDENIDESDDETVPGNDKSKDARQKKASKRMVINDDEEDEDNEDDKSEELKANLAKQSDSHISLGVFGGNLSQSFESNTESMKQKLDVSLSQLYDKGSQTQKKLSGDIFEKLRASKNDSTYDISIDDNGDIEPPSPLENTQNINENSDEDESLTQRDSFSTKRLVRRRNIESESSDDEEEIEQSEEQKQERLKEIEAMKERRRLYEKEQLRKKKEMKAKGLDKIMEAEAEESEDEWHGIGGAEGEGSDLENSEDEKMLDDYSKFRSNRSALAQKVAAEDMASDKKMVDRLLYDVEHGKLARRGGNIDGDLDLSDGEDEVMRSYRIYNQLKLREQLEKDEALNQLAKDKRSKAFFQSITEDSQLDSKNDIFNGEEIDDSDDDEESNPFNDAPKRDEFKDPSSISKKKKVTEKFVQKQLSFISNGDEEFDESKRKRRYSDFDEFDDDLSSLKQNSIIKIPNKTPQRRKVVDLDKELNDDTSPSNIFKMPSITKSFRKVDSDSFNSNEVTVSTSYKTASNSKSSIMSFGKKAEETKISSKASELRQTHRILKVRKISKIVQRGNILKSFDGSGDFD